MGRFPGIRFRGTTLEFDRPRLLAVINVTPDSFSDGGLHGDVEAAVAFGLRLVADGADVLDVGGESTRPGARPVEADEEAARVVPVVRGLVRRVKVPIAIDTTKAAVADAALAAGAEIVNDVSGGLFDPRLVEVAARAGAAYICGHVRGTTIADVHDPSAVPPTFEEVAAELGARLAALPPELRARTLVDPCLGFGKGTSQNVECLARAGELGRVLERPVVVGPSRKRFLGELTGRPVGERDDATVGACLAAAAAGADVLRVHDVRRVRDALVVFEQVRAGGAR